MKDNKDIELRSDEIRDILRKVPHWFVRWGITIIFGAVLLLLLFSWLFRYPELIHSKVVVSAGNPPAVIKARATGKITSLYVSDGDLVQQRMLMAVIENPARTDDVMQLVKYVEKLQDFMGSMSETDFPENQLTWELGPIQEYYTNFVQKTTDYFNFIRQDFYRQRIESVAGQIEMQNVLLERFNEQHHFEKEKLTLAQRSFERDSQLHSKALISEDDMEQSKNKWITLQLAYETFKTNMVETRLGLFVLTQTKAELQQDYNQTVNQYISEINRSYELLKNALREWQLTYLLESPIDGLVSFSKIWASNQNVAIGDVVLTIVPDKPMFIVGKAFVPTRGVGKVKPGQRVNIKLDNYPYMEYGMLVGEVSRIAPVPNDELYTIEIALPQELTTNYNKSLDMQQELWGKCEIITADLRLIQRVVYPIKAIIEKNRR